MSDSEIQKRLQVVGKHLQKYAGKVVYRFSSEATVIECREGDTWRQVQPQDTPDIGPFGQAIALVPSGLALFQHRTFPADIVARNDLNEAIQLDLVHWSPWGGESASFYLAWRNGNLWNVSLWVWEKQTFDRRLADLQASGLPLTHVVPEDVWLTSGLTSQEYPLILIHQHQIDVHAVFYLEKPNQVFTQAFIKSEDQIQFFLRGLGAKADAIKSVLVTEVTDPQQIPWNLPIELKMVPLRLPPFSILDRGLIPGVKDWRHPSAWTQPFYAVTALLLVWMLGSALVVWSKGSHIASSLAAASQGAEEVIAARARVDDISTRLQVITNLQRQQQVPIELLKELSVALPADVWLQTMTFRQDAVEIRGQGKNAATLAGLLENMKYVSRVNYVGDIRPDRQSGQEFFALRLQLDTGSDD